MLQLSLLLGDVQFFASCDWSVEKRSWRHSAPYRRRCRLHSAAGNKGFTTIQWFFSSDQHTDLFFLSWLLFFLSELKKKNGPKLHPLVPKGPASPWQPSAAWGGQRGGHSALCLLPGPVVRRLVQRRSQQVAVRRFSISNLSPFDSFLVYICDS